MKTTLNLLPGTAALALVGALTMSDSASAQSIYVPNHSFESPSAEGMPFDTNPTLDSWQKIAEPDFYQFLGEGIPPWYGTAGAFANVSMYNPTPYGNVDGAQAGYILMVPGVTLFQDYSTTPEFDAVFEVGKAYTLTIGLFAKSSFGTIPEGSTLELSLYYRDELNDNEIVTIASTVVSYDATTFAVGPELNLIDYQVNLDTVEATDAWAGKHIGIQLESTIPLEMTSFGNWDFDNIRLTAVPEPTALALVGMGLGGFLLRRTRRQN